MAIAGLGVFLATGKWPALFAGIASIAFAAAIWCRDRWPARVKARFGPYFEATRLGPATGDSAEAIAGRWLTELTRCELDAFPGGVDEETREFLRAGLPRTIPELSLTFDLGESALRGDWWRFGSDSQLDLCLELADGTVVARDPTGALPGRFVNASFPGFVRTLVAYAEWLLGPPGSLVAFRSLREAIAAADPAALEGTENWWALVVEDDENQLGEPGD